MSQADLQTRLISRFKPEPGNPECDADSLPRRFGGILQIAAANFLYNNDLLWASALTYTLILSIVPVLALAFSVAKRLAGLEHLQPLVAHYIALDSPVVTEKLMYFIAHTNAAALGSVGAATLLVTDITTLSTIEHAFNHIWKVSQGRSYIRKFTDYLSVTFTVPVLLAVALGLNASFERYSRFRGLSSFVPLLLVWPGFLFLFEFFPYTKVRWGPALLGSFVTAVLWQLAQWGYVHFQVGVASYQALYGALAAIPILLVWLYISWAIVLFGVEICAAAQHGALAREDQQTPNFARRAALLVMVRLGERLLNRRDLVTAESLAQELGITETTLTSLLERLKHSGLVVEGRAEQHERHARGLFLTRDPASLTVDQIINIACGREEPGATEDPRIVGLLERLDRTDDELLRSITLRDLLSDAEAAISEEPARRAGDGHPDAKA